MENIETAEYIVTCKMSFAALAVYNRSPSAYEALRDCSILQLPCTKVLKKVLKDGAEKPGIDLNYF